MERRGGRRFDVRPIINVVKERLRVVNPFGASVPESEESRRLRSLPGTKAHADDAEGKIPFSDIEGHRKLRKRNEGRK